MSELIVVSFDDKFKAEQALLNLLKLEQANLASLEDAVVVVKNAEGKVRVKAYHDLLEPVPELGNDLWGGVISAIVFHRTIKINQGVFDADFLTDVEASLTPNSSALFVVVSADTSEPVVAELSNVGGTLLRTPLPEVAHQQLKNGVKAVRQ
jgi:uncharacterized membrane protein